MCVCGEYVSVYVGVGVKSPVIDNCPTIAVEAVHK